MVMDSIYFVIFGIFLLLFFNKRVVGNSLWQATITPLASIIGSGFLVAAPILNSLNSSKSTILMLFLCLISYSIGVVIRWNIQNVEGKGNSMRPRPFNVENLSS